MSDDSIEAWDGVVTTEALRAWAHRVPDSADGTERLCLAVYGRPAQPRDFLGGSQARMLYDAADVIAKLRRERENDAAVKRATRRAEVAESERDAIRERVRALEAVDRTARALMYGQHSPPGAWHDLRLALDAAEPGTREPDDGKVRGSLAEAVEVVKSLPGPSREVKRISEWNRLCREQKRGGDR